MRPGSVDVPLGLVIASAARSISRAFDDVLQGVGGSRAAWLILTALATSPSATQREIAEAIGIHEATLTHHLNRMEDDGLVARRRDPSNRRVHLVDLTAAGAHTFRQMSTRVIAFDEAMCAGVSEDEQMQFRRMLAKLETNITARHS